MSEVPADEPLRFRGVPWVKDRTEPVRDRISFVNEDRAGLPGVERFNYPRADDSLWLHTDGLALPAPLTEELLRQAFEDAEECNSAPLEHLFYKGRPVPEDPEATREFLAEYGEALRVRPASAD